MQRAKNLHSRFVLAAGLLIFLTINCNAQYQYPPSKTADSTDVYWGQTIKDPYRWMEHLSDTAVQSWFRNQGAYTTSILSKIKGRDALFQALVKMDGLKKANYSDIIFVDSTWFYKKRGEGQVVASLYYRIGEKGKEILLFDPTRFVQGKIFNIKNFKPSPHATHITIETASGGNEVSTVRVMRVSDRQFYKDTIYPSLYGVTDWLDENSFMYIAHSSFDPNALAFHENTVTRVHRIGTKTTTDRVILSAAKYPGLGIAPEEICAVGLDQTHKFLIGNLGTASLAQRIYYAPVSDLHSDIIHWKPLFKREDEVTDFYVHGGDVYFLSFHGAPRYRILKTKMDSPDIAKAQEIFAQSDKKIEEINISRDFLIVRLTDGINDKLWKYEFSSGKKENVMADISGSLSISFAGNKTNHCIIGATSWIKPFRLYDLNTTTNRIRKSVFDSSIDYPGMEEMEVREVEVPAKDGVMVPLSIIYKKGTKMDGNNSCIMSGYGCYGISIQPYFSNFNLILIQKGIVCAYAHVRGGGEKGEDWHMGGYKATKPNTWNDFISCADYLIEKGYTRKERLAAISGSAGGILISRAVTTRPELFSVVVCQVADANALRSEFGTDGPSNSKEYGTVKDSVECMALIEMDGLHHVQANTKYPAILCTTGMNDDRVAPWQPGKFAAAMQNNSVSGKPVLMRVDYNNGHFTEDRKVTFNNSSDMYAFILWQTGHPEFQ
jgi:prolyl oligopeptidase